MSPVYKRSKWDLGHSHWWVRYGVAAIFTLSALLLEFLPGAAAVPFMFFYGAVALSARICGFRPAIFAAILSAAVTDFFLLPPRFSFSLRGGDLLRLSWFVSVALVISSLAKQKSEAQKAADERRAQLAGVVESSTDTIFNKTLDGTILTWNRAAQELYGYRPDEIIGKNVGVLAPPEKSTEIVGILERLRRGEKIAPFETERVTKDGRRLQISLSISPVQDENGNIVEAATIARDVTERRKAEEALKANQERLRGIVESAMDAIITVDKKQRIVVFNAAAQQIFLCPASEALGQPLDKFIPAKYRNVHRQHINNFGSTGVTSRSMYSPGNLLGLRADGEEFPIEATISTVELGGERLYSVILRDITERKRAEAALQLSEERFRAAHAMANVSAFDWNFETGDVAWFTKLPALRDLAPDEKFDTWMKLTHPEDKPRLAAAIQRLLKEGSAEIETRVVRPDGQFVWLSTWGKLYRNEDGKRHCLGVSMDITQRKRGEEALRRVEKLATAGQLGATIAHELNNPLEAVTNLIYLVRKNKSLDEKARKQLEYVDQELARMAHMTRRTLGFYRDTSAPVEVDLAELMDDVLALYERPMESKRIKIQKEYLTHAEVTVFPGEMRKVFSNLIANAIDAVSSGGHITVRMKNARNWRNPDQFGVRTTVADSGHGIKPADVSVIFEAFYTTKKETGTGLGLWLSKDIVHKHGGSIALRSSTRNDRNCRTAFSVFIPAQKTAVDNASEERQLA